MIVYPLTHAFPRARGFNGRLQTEALVLDELTLIHMNNFLPPDPNDPRIKLDSTLKKRKELQLINELEETDAMVETKEKIKELEAQEMREIMQERINVWLNVNRDPEFNEYPPFPKVNQGGSRDIIDPPPQLWRPEDEKKKGGDDKGKKKKPKKGKHGIRMPSEPEADGEDVPLCPNYFGRHIKRALEAYIETWHDKDDYNNHQQKYIPDILKNTLRPLVFEEARSCSHSSSSGFFKLNTTLVHPLCIHIVHSKMLGHIHDLIFTGAN